jgi:hypothetical protein
VEGRIQQDPAASSNEDIAGPTRLFQSISMRSHSEKLYFHLGKKPIDRSSFIPTRLPEDRISTSRHSGSTPVEQNAHFRTKLERAIPFTAFKLVLLT